MSFFNDSFDSLKNTDKKHQYPPNFFLELIKMKFDGKSKQSFNTQFFQKKKKIMIRKDRNFCDQILEAVAMLDKSSSTFFSILILLFSKIFMFHYKYFLNIFLYLS